MLASFILEIKSWALSLIPILIIMPKTKIDFGIKLNAYCLGCIPDFFNENYS